MGASKDKDNGKDLERRLSEIETQLALFAQDAAHADGEREDGWGVGDDETGPEIPPCGGGDEFPWSLLAFGYSILDGADAGKVRIQPGHVEWHGPDETAYLAAASADLTITANRIAVVYVEWIFSTNAVQVAFVEVETTEEYALASVDSDADALRVPLYCFQRDAGSVVRLVRIYHMGNVSVIPRQAP